MLACQSSATSSPNQDSSRRKPPEGPDCPRDVAAICGMVMSMQQLRRGPVDNRRVDADLRRVADCVAVMAYHKMKQTHRQIFAYLSCKCILGPIMGGESDRIATVPDNAAEIARWIGLDRTNVHHSLQEFVELGYASRRNGRLWISPENIRRIIDDEISPRIALPFHDANGDEADDVVESTTRQTSDVVNPTTRHEGNLPPASIEDAEAPARSIRMNSNSGELNSENSGSCVSSWSSLESANSDQDDTHTRMNARLKHPLSPEEETRIIAFCDTHFPMMAVAENYLTNCRGLFPSAWIVKALKRAKLARKCRWAYVREIMRSWECVGGPDPGEEDRFDDDMNPIPVEVAAILPISSPAAPARPLSQRQRTAADVARMRDLNAKGVDWLRLNERAEFQPRTNGDRT